MKYAAMIAVVSLFTTGSAVLAETSAQRAACTPDVWRLCAADIPDVGAIKTCLRRERPRLSPSCRVVMDSIDKPAATLAAR